MLQTLAKPDPTLPAPTSSAELAHVTMTFGRQTVLRDLSFKVSRGETLVIIGESGCGKSVTTKLLAGLLEPTSGSISWDGRALHDRSSVEMRRDRLRRGYLFQGAALFDSMNVFENIAFAIRENAVIPENQLRHLVFDRLREVGLADGTASKYPSDLSGGMKKRVGLARALAMSPDVMFYDEPTTGLDPIMTSVINELIVQTQEQREVTSIVVTHEMSTVRRVADRVVMLEPISRVGPNGSQIVFQGACEELFACEDERVRKFVHGADVMKMRPTKPVMNRRAG